MKIVPAHVDQDGTKLVAGTLVLVDGIIMTAAPTNATAYATIRKMSAAEDLALRGPKPTVELAPSVKAPPDLSSITILAHLHTTTL